MGKTYIGQRFEVPAEDGEGLHGPGVLRGLVGVEDTILEDKPGPLPLAVLHPEQNACYIQV